MIKKSIALPCLVMVTAFLFIGCDSHYFSQPQPVDAKSIYTFPKKFRGEWVQEGEPAMVISSDKVVVHEQVRIFNGIQYLKAADTLTEGSKMTWRKGLQTIGWSKSMQRMDTVTNYVIRGARIFELGNDHVKAGLPFEIIGDSIQINGGITLTLGQNLFLRKVNDTIYVLNVRLTNPVQEMEGRGPWWTIQLLELDRRGRLYQRGLDDGVTVSPSLIMAFKHDYFYDSQWTSKDILSLRETLFDPRDKFYTKANGKR